MPRKPQPTMGVMASKALAAKRCQQLEVEWENNFIKQAEALIEKKYVFLNIFCKNLGIYLYYIYLKGI